MNDDTKTIMTFNKLKRVETKVNNIDTKTDSVLENVKTNNSASETGTLSQKLSYIISSLKTLVSTWTSTRAAKIDTINANVNTLISKNGNIGQTCVVANQESTNLLATVIGTDLKLSGNRNYYVTCPFTGSLKIEATISVTNNRSNSGSGYVSVSCQNINGTVESQSVQVCHCGDGQTKTSSVVIYVQAGTWLCFYLQDAKYETVTINSVKIYGTIKPDSFYYLWDAAPSTS